MTQTLLSKHSSALRSDFPPFGHFFLSQAPTHLAIRTTAHTIFAVFACQRHSHTCLFASTSVTALVSVVLWATISEWRWSGWSWSHRHSSGIVGLPILHPQTSIPQKHTPPRVLLQLVAPLYIPWYIHHECLCTHLGNSPVGHNQWVASVRMALERVAMEPVAPGIRSKKDHLEQGPDKLV